MMINIDKEVFVKTKATRKEIEEAYSHHRSDINSWGQFFTVNNEVLGYDNARATDFIFWCYSEDEKDLEKTNLCAVNRKAQKQKEGEIRFHQI